jgi:hypothetical protein
MRAIASRLQLGSLAVVLWGRLIGFRQARVADFITAKPPLRRWIRQGGLASHSGAIVTTKVKNALFLALSRLLQSLPQFS